MTSITGTINPDLYAGWRPGLRTLALIVLAGVGLVIWAHAAWHPEASWYMVESDSYAGLYELGGGLLVVLSAMGSFVLLLIPWQARRSVENRIEITIRNNELCAIGRGRNSEISKCQLASKDKLFSSESNLIESPLHLREEAESLLYSLELRFKPFVLIKVEGTATPAELMVIQQAFHSINNVLDYRLVEPSV